MAPLSCTIMWLIDSVTLWALFGPRAAKRGGLKESSLSQLAYQWVMLVSPLWSGGAKHSWVVSLLLFCLHRLVWFWPRCSSLGTVAFWLSRDAMKNIWTASVWHQFVGNSRAHRPQRPEPETIQETILSNKIYFKSNIFIRKSNKRISETFGENRT